MKVFALNFLLILCLCSCKSTKTDYDVVIVGGGFAGLSAAHTLNNDKVLLLEKDSLMGGRVFTANFENKYFYDLGAVFALDDNYRKKFNLNYDEIEENEPIGFWIDNQLYSGSTVMECLRKLPNIDSNYINKIYNSDTILMDSIPQYLYDILNTNIKAVFPGAMKEYNHIIQKYAWERYNSSHFREGNSIITKYLLNNTKFQYRNNCKVIDITDNEKYATITYIENNQHTKTVTAKKVIVATPAYVANTIVKKKNPHTQKFLSGVRYAGYYSIALGVSKKVGNPSVSYLMPVGTGFSSILKQSTVDSNFTIFQLYIAQEDFSLFKDSTDMIRKSEEIVAKIWDLNLNNIKYSDIYHWKNAGVLINEHYLKHWNNEAFHPSKHVYICGDYCETEYSMPYGMIPALHNGEKTALKIKKKPWSIF